LKNLVAVVALLGGLSAAFVVSAEIPPVMYANLDFDRTYPTWVDATAAVGSDGQLDKDLFHPDHLLVLEHLLETPEDPETGCILMEEVFESWINPPDRSSVSKAANHSALVFFGKVLSISQGFDRGVPGHMVEISPEQVLKGAAELETYYVFLPVGEVQVGPHNICKKDYRYPQPIPEPGDELLLMVPRVAEAEPYLDLVYSTSFALLPQEGGVYLSKEYEETDTEQLKSAADLRNEVRLAVQATGDER